MKKSASLLKVGFTYVGTVVGAGFATGQEILQFFTRYGWLATLTIGIACALFIWLGIKLMLLSNQLKAKSYEDLNKLLFGERIGGWVSLLTMITLFGVVTVMLAGAGSVFSEQLQLSYQWGMLFTIGLTYVLLKRGMDAILDVNTIVVPCMVVFCCIAIALTIDSPGSSNWLTYKSDYPLLKIWFAPLLYAAFNLSMAQAVLVPLGARIEDRSVLVWGGILGGIFIGFMLLASHFALSAQMPNVLDYDIPMGQLAVQLGSWLQILFTFVIYSEIFTTFMADVYGLSLQIQQRMGFSANTVIIVILGISYAVSQIGFKTLLSSLYPLFGMFSVVWMVLLIRYRNSPLNRA